MTGVRVPATGRRSGTRALLLLAAIAAIALHTPPDAGAAGATGTDPCANQTSFEWQGDSIAEAITIPSLTSPSSLDSYAGTILRPADTKAYPGKRPVVVLQHGIGGDQCAMWWTAEALAGNGYVVLVWTSTVTGGPMVQLNNAVDAMRSAIAFSRTAANPFAGFSDTDQIVVSGFSLGSIAASIVQQDPDPGVVAAVAIDNLRRYLDGDTGGVLNECTGATAGEIIPRVPALGFAMDGPCSANASNTSPDIKQPGFLAWRNAGLDTALFVMAGFEHTDFARDGTEAQHRLVFHFIEGWLDYEVLGDLEGRQQLLAEEAVGQPTKSILSSQFLSGASLEPTIDTTDYVAHLDEFGGPPSLKQGSGPKDEVTKRDVKRGKVKFRFSSNDPAATFECRLDSKKPFECESPEKLKKASAGKHKFSVTATDAGGTEAKKTARWRFEVV